MANATFTTLFQMNAHLTEFYQPVYDMHQITVLSQIIVECIVGLVSGRNAVMQQKS